MNYKRALIIVAGLMLLVSTAGFLSAKDDSSMGDFSKTEQAFYLTEEDIAFIRPGLNITLLDVTIPSDRRPEVRFMLTDPGGLPLDRDGVFTPGPVSTSFVLSYIPEGEEAYVAYTTRVQTSPITGDSATQASTDSDGEYTTEEMGTYHYKFSTELPAGYNADATHTLGVYGRRDLREFSLDRYVDNALEHWVPSGNGTAVPRDIVTTETCNGACHDPLAIHGGQRTEVGLCVLCHNSTQSIDPDTGNSVYFPLMVHKIHAGAELTNGYTIIGFRQSVHDYSHVEYPGILNDCESCHTGGTPMPEFPLVANPETVESCDRKGKGATTFSWDYAEGNPVTVRINSPDGKVFARGGPQDSRTTGNWVRDSMDFFLVDETTGETVQEMNVNTTVFGCNGPAPGRRVGVPGTQHTAWLTNPGRDACGACHDDVNFATGEGHSEINLVVEDDTTCHLCHQPDTGVEYDRSIRGAHTVDYKSNQLGGILVEIDKVKNTGPGRQPVIDFWLSDKNGLLDPSDLGRLRFNISGPNEDFDFYVQEDALVPDALTAIGAGKYSYQFEAALPMDASGSYSVGAEGRINSVTINPGTDDEFTLRDQMQNFVTAFAVTDEEPVARRMIVDDAKCETCHNNLSLHGGNRHEAQYCTTCHMPDATDEAVRPEEALPVESIHFKYLIHKLHRGAELENGFVVYGFRSSVHDFGHVEFPGDLRNCDTCHVNNSQQLPLPDGLLNTPTPSGFFEYMEPETSACLSCHDSFNAAAHAAANTGSLGESCSTCHGEDKAYSVDFIHAR